MSAIIYIVFVAISALSLLAGAWLDTQLQPLISLQWVQQALIDTAAYLLSYVVAVWGFILLVAIFGKHIEGEGEGVKNISATSTLIAVGAQVGIPLSLLVWLTITTVL